LASNVVRVWDCQSHSFATPELVHPRQVLALAFSANGARLATGCEDLQARVFAIAGQLGGANPLFPPVGHRLRENEHMHMPISPTFIDQDRGLLTVTDPRTVAWRDAGTGEQLRPVPAEAPAVSSIAVSPDGRHFALGSWEKTSLWEVTAGRRIGQQPSQEHMVVSATFSPDGATLITGSMNTARPWSIPAGEPVGPVLRHQGRVLHAAYSADGRLFATADQRGLVRVWIITLGNHPDQRLPLEGKATALRLSCDGCYLIATGSSWPAACLPSARVYDASTFQPAGPPLRPGGIVTGADLSPDGRHAVTLNTLGQAHFWDWRTGEKSMEPVATPSEPRAVRYTPDGRLAIVACVGGQVLAVDASTGQVTRRLQHGVPYDRTVRGSLPGDAYLDISSDGRRFLSCSIDGFVRICETATGRPCYRPLQHANIPGMGRFSPDAQLLLTAARDSTVRVWDATSGGPTGRVLTHPTYIDDACISPDGQHVLTACTDGMARLWDWRTGILVCPPFQHARHVPGACFTPDGVFVLTTAFDLTARVWEWHTGKPVTPPLSISGYGIRVLTTPDGSHAFVSGMASFIDVISLRDLYARDEIERDDLCTLGEILSGQRLHEGGDVVNLTADEWLERWRRFRQRYPEYSRLDWPPEQVIAWHRREADKNLRAEQWFTAVWHLDRLIAREPKNWRHYRDRSQAHRALGQKDAADADQARASARKKSHE
jgi:WD40 repeat protein